MIALLVIIELIVVIVNDVIPQLADLLVHGSELHMSESRLCL